MQSFETLNKWIDDQQSSMVDIATKWSNINSHVTNHTGLKILTKDMIEEFSVFNEPVQTIELPEYEVVNAKGIVESFPAAPAISVQKRPNASKKVLLVCHIDTVFMPDGPFIEVKKIDDNRLSGPGITDAKGGIVVMLKALQAFEQSPCAQHIGWQVIINADEEIGSPSSDNLLRQTAKSFDMGLVFEPSLPNGDLVGSRKGSGNFTIVVRGKPAHAGRNPHEGRNAIVALTRWITLINNKFLNRRDITINFGIIHGGSAFNVVADFAMLKYNIRYIKAADQTYLADEIQKITQIVMSEFGVKIEIHGFYSAPPKPLDERTLKMFHCAKECAQDLDFSFDWQDSGGVCDGNRLAAAGLPTIDTLGVVGGGIHSLDEYVCVDSFTQRTKLTVLLLLKWAQDELII